VSAYYLSNNRLLITLAETAVWCDRIKTRIQFNILYCTTARKFFNVPLKTHQSI